MQPLNSMQTHSTAPLWTYEDLGILLGAALPCLLLSALAAKLTGLALTQKGVITALSQTVLYAALLLALYLLLSRRYRLRFWQAMDWRVPWRHMAFTALLGPLLAVSMGLLALLLGARPEPTAMDELLQDRWSILAIALAATTIGPIFEELIFRGFAQPLFVNSLGLIGGLIVTALPFSLLHGPQYNWSWQRLLILTLASIVFGLVRHLTGSTAASSLTHASYNLTFVAGMISQGDPFNRL
jgi:membrane protease YdiL (CAAX protease family)